MNKLFRPVQSQFIHHAHKAFAIMITQCLVACQFSKKSDPTEAQQFQDVIHEAEGSGTVVIVVIALIVAWMILLGFLGRINKVKSS